jgi:hypothetical protein
MTCRLREHIAKLKEGQRTRFEYFIDIELAMRRMYRLVSISLERFKSQM